MSCARDRPALVEPGAVGPLGAACVAVAPEAEGVAAAGAGVGLAEVAELVDGADDDAAGADFALTAER